MGVRPRTDTQTDTQTRVTTIHFASSTTHAKCNDSKCSAISTPWIIKTEPAFQLVTIQRWSITATDDSGQPHWTTCTAAADTDHFRRRLLLHPYLACVFYYAPSLKRTSRYSSQRDAAITRFSPQEEPRQLTTCRMSDGIPYLISLVSLLRVL